MTGFEFMLLAHLVSCHKEMVAVIQKCDLTQCEVQFVNGTFGKVKLPVEVGQVIEVCP